MKNFLFIFLLLPILTIAQDQRKIALVIGNKNYDDPNGVLANPLNDSRLMFETFEALEFDSVIVANDLTYNEMRQVFRGYRNSLKMFDVGFIYYSGHGMQDAYNETYLIPIDFPPNSNIDDVMDYGYSIQDILKSLDNEKLNVFILDACRDNPYERSWKGRSLKGNGLSEPIVPPSGSLVAYSTSPGDVASDNSDSNNSLYTKALSVIMQQPNLKIEEVFKKVRTKVYSGSDSTQNPQWWGQLDGDLYLLIKDDTKVISLEKELKNSFEKLKKYEDYLETNYMKMINVGDSNNVGNLDLLEFFITTSKYANGKEDNIYVLSLFGVMKVGLSASTEIVGDETLSEDTNYATKVSADATYELYRFINNISDDELEKILYDFYFVKSVEEFRLRVKIGYLFYAIQTKGESDSFNYDELKNLMNDMYCNKEELNNVFLLYFVHLFQQYSVSGYINKSDINCFYKFSKNDSDVLQNLVEISKAKDEDERWPYLYLQTMSGIFHEYYEMYKSNNILTDDLYNTSYGLYFISYERARFNILNNYALLLNNIDYKLIESNENKDDIIAFLSHEINLVNEIGHNLFQVYNEKVKIASDKNENYEYNVIFNCYDIISSLNNTFFLVGELKNYEYQYQNIKFSNYKSIHANTILNGINKFKDYYLKTGYTEYEFQQIIEYYEDIKVKSNLNFYAGINTLDDYSKYDLGNLQEDCLFFLNDYFYNKVERNINVDSLYESTILDYIYFKSRYCMWESKSNKEEFKCYEDISDFIINLDYTVEYNPEFYDNISVDHFWEWYSFSDLKCESKFTDTTDLNNCFKENATLLSKMALDHTSFYEEKYNGLGNRLCFYSLDQLINHNLKYLNDTDDFTLRVNEYMLKYTASLIGLTSLRSDLGDSIYTEYSVNSIDKYFNRINYFVDSVNSVNINNKELITMGSLFKLNSYLESFNFSQNHLIIQDILKNKIKATQIKFE